MKMPSTPKALKYMYKKIRTYIPNIAVLNGLLMAPRFVACHKRLPRLNHPRTSFYDYVFYRMIRNNWTVLEQTCADKEYAKIVAAGLCPEVRVPVTHGVMAITPATTASEIRAFCQPFIGKPYVMKPTHNAGGVVFLKPGAPSSQDMEKVLRIAKANFFHMYRETQYAHLQPKLIIEEELSVNGQVPDDIKLFCARGKVLYAMVVKGRFNVRQREIYTLPAFTCVHAEAGGHPLGPLSQEPKQLKAILHMAEKLSQPFESVRIDLCETPHGIYFGEFTFTPFAALDDVFPPHLAEELLHKTLASAPSAAPKTRSGR